jgi:hypothetical protein
MSLSFLRFVERVLPVEQSRDARRCCSLDLRRGQPVLLVTGGGRANTTSGLGEDQAGSA